MNVWNIKTTSINVQRTINATPAEVFDAWLDPNSEGSPWNGVTKAILQPMVDGLFYRMHPSEQGDYELAHYGRFLVTIKHTLVSQHTRGLESVVTVRFAARQDATRVVIQHENLPDDEKGRMHEGGWSHYLDQVSWALVRPAKMTP
jgi:uncharacterized protein YndB with AHSA1/START domain